MIRTRTQSGNTMVGLIIGLLLASVVIALLLWFLNQDKNISQPTAPSTTEQHPTTQTETIPPGVTPKEIDELPTIASENQLGTTDSENKDDKITTLIKDIEQKEKTVKNAPPQNKANRQQDIESKKVEKILNNQSTITSPKNNQVIMQVGSFTQESQAKERQAQLILLNIPTTIVTASVKGNTVYRVQTAPSSADAAIKMKQLLMDNKIESLILNTK